MITQEYLKEKLHYDPETGIFSGLSLYRNKTRMINTRAGSTGTDRYVKIRIDKKYYQAHRLAFLYMTGEIPKLVDHKNRNITDNRWCNLRPVTDSQNQMNQKIMSNNTSGYRGVVWNKNTRKWIAQLTINRKVNYIGSFDCKHHAFCEYVLLARKHFGEFCNV